MLLVTLLSWALSSAPTIAPPDAARCLVTGRPLHLSLTVHPTAGDAGFPLTLTGATVTVTMPATADAPAEVHATAPLIFDAQVAANALPLRVAKRTTLADGRLVLVPKTPLVPGLATGDALAFTASPVPGVRIAPLTLPCASLAFGEADPEEAWMPDVKHGLAPVRDSLELRTAPDAPAPLVVTVEHSIDLRLAVLARRAGWTRVEGRWNDGTTLMGWVEDAALTPQSLAMLSHLGKMRGACGYGVSDTYVGPATLHAGAEVRDGADGPVWAHAAAAVKVIVVGRGGESAELAEIPGLGDAGCRLDHATARSADLTYPR